LIFAHSVRTLDRGSLAGTGGRIDEEGRTRMKTLAIVPLLLGVPALVMAAPLCRDAKGLFTPCTPAETTKRRDAEPRHRPTPVPDAAPDANRAPASREARPAHRERRPAVATGRLCRDGKGLFTPCAPGSTNR
jgi:hypothetical protein